MEGLDLLPRHFDCDAVVASQVERTWFAKAHQPNWSIAMAPLTKWTPGRLQANRMNARRAIISASPVSEGKPGLAVHASTARQAVEAKVSPVHKPERWGHDLLARARQSVRDPSWPGASGDMHGF